MCGRGREITAVKVSDHPAHSPELGPSDSHLFWHIKKHLASQKSDKDEEVKNEVTMYLCVQAVEFCDIRIQKLISRLSKCPDKGADYVEKLLKVWVKSILLINICKKILLHLYLHALH